MAKALGIDPATAELERFKANVKKLAEKYGWIDEYKQRFEQKEA